MLSAVFSGFSHPLGWNKIRKECWDWGEGAEMEVGESVAPRLQISRRFEERKS